MITNSDFVFIPLKHKLHVTNLISLFHYKYPKHYVFDGESHDFWEFIYVDQGTLEITADNQKYLLKTGEITFHKPCEFHAVRTHTDKPASAIICSFTCTHPDMKFFEGYRSTLHAKERGYLSEMLYLRAQLFFNDSVPFHSSPRPTNKIPFMYLQTVQSYLELILLSILIRNNYHEKSQEADSARQTDSYHMLTQNVISYMEQNIEKKLTLQQIADAVGYSVPHMKKLFHNDLKQGVMDFFIKLKIDEAKHMLEERVQPLSLIAATLGFNDSAYLCRKFKQYEGMTPSEFKRTCLTGKQ